MQILSLGQSVLVLGEGTTAGHRVFFGKTTQNKAYHGRDPRRKKEARTYVGLWI